MAYIFKYEKDNSLYTVVKEKDSPSPVYKMIPYKHEGEVLVFFLAIDIVWYFDIVGEVDAL